MPYAIDGWTLFDYGEQAAEVAAVMFPMRQSMYRHDATPQADAGKGNGEC